MNAPSAIRTEDIRDAVAVFDEMPSEWKVRCALHGADAGEVVVAVSGRIDVLVREGRGGLVGRAALQVWKREFMEYVSATLGLL